MNEEQRRCHWLWMVFYWWMETCRIDSAMNFPGGRRYCYFDSGTFAWVWGIQETGVEFYWIVNHTQIPYTRGVVGLVCLNVDPGIAFIFFNNRSAISSFSFFGWILNPFFFVHQSDFCLSWSFMRSKIWGVLATSPHVIIGVCMMDSGAGVAGIWFK